MSHQGVDSAVSLLKFLDFFATMKNTVIGIFVCVSLCIVLLLWESVPGVGIVRENTSKVAIDIARLLSEKAVMLHNFTSHT